MTNDILNTEVRQNIYDKNLIDSGLLTLFNNLEYSQNIHLGVADKYLLKRIFYQEIESLSEWSDLDGFGAIAEALPLSREIFMKNYLNLPIPD